MSEPDYFDVEREVMEALGVVGKALNTAVGVVRNETGKAMQARSRAAKLQGRVNELERVLRELLGRQVCVCSSDGPLCAVCIARAALGKEADRE